jgi:glycosyltransferase involved in cell wall biosynthesis
MDHSSRLPILFLARGGDINGQQRQVLYLAAGLAERNSTVTAVLNEPGNLLSELSGLGIESHVARMSSWRSPARIVDRYVDALNLLKLARRQGALIVHAHDVWRAEYARFIAKRLATPYVVHVRGPLSPRDIAKHRLNLADSVIAIAQRYVDDLIHAGIERSRIVLIDDAVNLELFAPTQADPNYVRRNFGIEGSLLVGFVGRLSAFKRVCEFLDIIRKLPPDLTDSVHFVVVGEWDNAEYRRQVEKAVVQLQLELRVHFIGRCPSRLMPNILSSLDLLLTLSGGSTMFEAMAMRKPVLSIRSDGRHSQHTRHRQTAWCVDGDNVSVAAEALARVLQDEPLRHKLGDAGRDWVIHNLSSSAMVAKVEKLYQGLAR